MDLPPPRVVTLVLCLPDGTVLGSLPPFDVEVPWWQEAGPVVDRARDLHGLDVVLLRLLRAPAHASAGGEVAYLAEVGEPVDGLRPVDDLPDSPLRLPWARPGGPAADLAWAEAELHRLGRRRTAPARQVRTWNLSSVWRLPLTDGAAWLKVLPPFLADEGRLLAALDPAVVPPVLAADARRVLLDEVPGDDLYEASGPLLDRMVSLLVGLQVAQRTRVPELLALGVADWRLEHLGERAGRALARTADRLEAAVVRACEAVVDSLDERAGAVASCGLPDTLVHGDFHPGNVRGDLRGDDARLVLLDWGDSGVGPPLLDQAAFLDRVPDAERPRLLARWNRLWRAAVPGCEPERAAELLRPFAALRSAVVYDTFLASIEPSEHPYHAADPARCLRDVARLSTPPGP